MPFGYIPPADYTEIGGVVVDQSSLRVDAFGTLSAPPATSQSLGEVIPDGTIITVDQYGNVTVPLATEVNVGVVEPDGTTLFVDQAGIISATLATATTPGIVEPDGTTIEVDAEGVLHVPIATTHRPGLVEPDGVSVDVTSGGKISVPIASTGTPGLVEPDGSTITVDGAGVISAVELDVTDGVHSVIPTTQLRVAGMAVSGSSPVATITPDTATTSQLGVVEPDGSTIHVDSHGVISVPIATTSEAGLVKPDGSTIHVAGDGTISAAPAGIVITDGPHSVSGVTTLDVSYMTVSGSTPNASLTPDLATDSTPGIVQVDGATIAVDHAGVISARAQSPPGAQGDIQEYLDGAWQAVPPGDDGEVWTAAAGSSGYDYPRIAMAQAGGVAGTRHEIDLGSVDGDIVITTTDDPAGDAVHYDLELNAALKAALGSGSGATIISHAGQGLVLGLWNGSGNNAPPTGWQDYSFNDASWSAPVAGTFQAPGGFPAPDGSQWVTYDDSGNTPQDAQWLHRQKFTLPSGVIQSAQLGIAGDNSVPAIYINGHLLGSVANTAQETIQQFTVPTSWLIPGGGNIIAIEFENNDAASGAGPDPAAGAFALTVSYTLSLPPGSSLPSCSEGALYYESAGAPACLPVGASGDLLTSNGTDPVWAAAPNIAAGAALAGSVSITITAPAADNSAAVTFASAFPSAPNVVVSSSDADLIAGAESATTTGFTARLRANVDLAPGTSITATLYWMATGSGSGGGGGSIASFSATQGAQVPMPSANTYYSGPAITLGAGTWLVQACLTGAGAAGTTADFTARIHNGSSAVASSSFTTAGSFWLNIALAVIVTPTTATTYTLQGLSNVAGAAIEAHAADNQGDNATIIYAIQLG